MKRQIAASAGHDAKKTEKKVKRTAESVPLHLDMAHELRKLVDSANAPIFGIDVEGKVSNIGRIPLLLL